MYGMGFLICFKSTYFHVEDLTLKRIFGVPNSFTRDKPLLFEKEHLERLMKVDIGQSN